MSKLQDRHHVLVQKYLEQELSRIKPGEALPPIRTMMKKSGASQSHLIRLLDQLESNNMVERRKRLGIFKRASDYRPLRSKIIEIVACGVAGYLSARNLYWSEFVEEFTAMAAKRGYSFRLHPFALDVELTEYELFASRTDVHACVLLAIHEPEIARIFDRNHVEWVGVFPRMPMPRNNLILDNPKMVEMQLSHLFDLGHRRIGYLSSEDLVKVNWTASERRERYYQLMAEHGVLVKPGWVAVTSGCDVSIFEKLEKMFAGDAPPTAIVASDGTVSAVYRFLERRGLVVGRDVSVMATDGMSLLSGLHPAVTSVINSRRVAAEMALDMLEKKLTTGDTAEPHYVPLELHVRESTGPASRE